MRTEIHAFGIKGTNSVIEFFKGIGRRISSRVRPASLQQSTPLVPLKQSSNSLETLPLIFITTFKTNGEELQQHDITGKDLYGENARITKESIGTIASSTSFNNDQKLCLDPMSLQATNSGNVALLYPTLSSELRMHNVDIQQLTLLEAFGVNIPSLLLSPRQSQIQLEHDYSNKIKRTSSPPQALPRPSERRRSHSMIDGSSMNRCAAGNIGKTSLERKIDKLMLISVSNEIISSNAIQSPVNASDANDSSSDKDSPQPKMRKSILKNSQLISPVKERQTNIDKNILIDYGGDVIHHSEQTKSKHSIMSTLAGKANNEILEDSVKILLDQEVPVFEAQLMKCMIPRVFEINDYIIRKHDIGNEMFFLSKGRVEILSSDCKTQYGIIKAGEMGVLFDIPRTASVRALERCVCVVLKRDRFIEVIAGFPTLEGRFRKVVQIRLREVQAMRARARRVRISISEGIDP